jgi:hypothetical protein
VSLGAFNVGIEAGQLLSIGAALCVAGSWKRLPGEVRLRDWGPVTAYAMGTLSFFGMIERSLSILKLS